MLLCLPLPFLGFLRTQFENSQYISQLGITHGKPNEYSENVPIYMLEKFYDHNDMCLVFSRSDRAHVAHMIYIILFLLHLCIIIPPYVIVKVLYILV